MVIFHSYVSHYQRLPTPKLHSEGIASWRGSSFLELFALLVWRPEPAELADSNISNIVSGAIIPWKVNNHAEMEL